jgi:hypothetical protein
MKKGRFEGLGLCVGLLPLLGLIALGDACSSASTSNTGDDASSKGSGTGTSTGTGSSSGSHSGSGCNGTELTVHNYLNWCDVAVGVGATPSTASSQSACFLASDAELPHSVISAVAEPGFQLWSGMWEVGIDGDKAGTVTGSGQGATSTVAIDPSGATACVVVCCANSASGSDCAGSASLCP